MVCCLEKWEEVDKKTGEIITKYSQHQWLSSICINIDNVHELCNLAARKIWLLEDSINTSHETVKLPIFKKTKKIVSFSQIIVAYNATFG